MRRFVRPDLLQPGRQQLAAVGVAVQVEVPVAEHGEERIVEARQAWKALGERGGIERRYWKQSEGGGWEQLA